jgi:hypothetical protein
MTIEEAQNKYLNKRVLVKKGIKNPNEVGGICEFLGPNQYLKIPLQITVDRLPITLESLDQISLMAEPWTIGKKNN